MKKLLILLLLSTSLSAFADSHLDFSLSDFCYQQPGVQDRGGVYYFPNEEVGISATSICVYKDAYGQHSSKGELINGKKDGKWTLWHVNGQKDAEVTYKDGKEVGKRITSWYTNGQIKTEAIYNDGKFVSESRYSYNENGQIKTEVNFKDGKVTRWFHTGQKRSELITKNNKQYSIMWHKNGNKKFEGSKINLKKDGKETEWYENGKKRFEGNYINGSRDGKFINWNESGKKTFEGIYLNDVSVNETNYSYWSNGQKRREINSKDGKLDGNFIQWNEYGKIIIKRIYKQNICISGDCD